MAKYPRIARDEISICIPCRKAIILICLLQLLHDLPRSSATNIHPRRIVRGVFDEGAAVKLEENA